jgi:hypothetical protein
MNVRLVLLPRKWIRGFRGAAADAERRSEDLIMCKSGADLATGKIFGMVGPQAPLLCLGMQIRSLVSSFPAANSKSLKYQLGNQNHLRTILKSKTDNIRNIFERQTVLGIWADG